MIGQTKSGLVAFYEVRPGNGAGLLFQPRSPHGAERELHESIMGVTRSRGGRSAVASRCNRFTGHTGEPRQRRTHSRPTAKTTTLCHTALHTHRLLLGHTPTHTRWGSTHTRTHRRCGHVTRPPAWSTYKSGRVVITDRLSVTVRLQYGISLYDLVLQCPLLLLRLQDKTSCQAEPSRTQPIGTDLTRTV